MKLLLQSSRRFFYRHPGQLLLALVGIAAGVAVVTGVALIRNVLLDALDLAGEELAGRDSVRIHHPAGPVDESAYFELATRPGAPALVPVLDVRVRSGERILELLATDPLAVGGERRLGLAGDTINALMRTPGGVAINRHTLQRLGLDDGQSFEVRIAGVTRELTVAAVLGDQRALDDRLLMDIAMAQDLLGRQGQLSWIEAAAEHREWLVEHLPSDLELVTAAQRRDSAAQLTAGMRANLVAMSLLSLAVGLFVIYSVMSFLLVQRRRTLGMLRAVGVTGEQIGRLLALETALLSALGALAGLALGTWLAGHLLELVRQPVAELYRLLPPASVQPGARLYAGVWLVAVIGALASTAALWREARTIAPGQLVRQSASSGGSGRTTMVIATSLLLAGLGVIVLTESLTAALAGLFVTLMGCALLCPTAGMATLRLLRLPLGSGTAGRALAMLSRGRRRLGPALSALGLALALSAGMGMMVLGFRLAVDDWVDRLLQADVYLTLGQGQIGPALAERVEAMAGVDAVSSARQSRLGDGRTLLAYDLPATAWEGFELIGEHRPDLREAFLSGRAVLVSEPYARHHGVRVGDVLSLPTPDRTLSLPVGGVYRDYASDQGVIAMDAELYRHHFNDTVRDSLGVYFHDRQMPDDWQEGVLDIEPRFVVTTREQVHRQTLAVFDRTFRISWALAVLVGMIAVVALVSALLALGLERRRDYATLRALGLPRRGLAAVVVSQTTGLAAASALLAVPLALAIHAGLTMVVQPRAFGWSLPLTFPVTPLVLMLPVALLAGVVAGIYPAWKIAARSPATELRSR